MEYDENTELGKYAFTVHCGSRNVGLKICKHWEHIGKGICFDKDKCNDEIKDFIKSFKGDSCDIPMHVDTIKKKYRIEGSEGYLRGDNLKGYLTDMVICQAYATFNRKIIFDIVNGIVQKLFQKDGGNKIVNHIASVHNYIDFNDMIIRKGAIRSYKGEEMIIPFNMKDGIAICEGKSNDDWNCTAPHGSGRCLSRSKAKKDIDLEHFKEEMKGIYTTSVCRNTLDEAPDAYKPTDEIIKNIEPTCDIKFFMTPKINIKDSSTSEER